MYKCIYRIIYNIYIYLIIVCFLLAQFRTNQSSISIQAMY